MSIEKNEPTEESVETTESNTGELSKDEADSSAGGIRRGGVFEGGDGGDPGDTGKELKYL